MFSVGLCHVVRAHALEQNVTAKEKILVDHTVFEAQKRQRTVQESSN